MYRAESRGADYAPFLSCLNVFSIYDNYHVGSCKRSTKYNFHFSTFMKTVLGNNKDLYKVQTRSARVHRKDAFLQLLKYSYYTKTATCKLVIGSPVPFVLESSMRL